jgi:hypothetical protein
LSCSKELISEIADPAILHRYAFLDQQPYLLSDSATVSSDPAVCADDAMTRNFHRIRIPV